MKYTLIGILLAILACSAPKRVQYDDWTVQMDAGMIPNIVHVPNHVEEKCDHRFVPIFYQLSDTTYNLIYQLLQDAEGNVSLPFRECICIHCKITDTCY